MSQELHLVIALQEQLLDLVLYSLVKVKLMFPLLSIDHMIHGRNKQELLWIKPNRRPVECTSARAHFSAYFTQELMKEVLEITD